MIPWLLFAVICLVVGHCLYDFIKSSWFKSGKEILAARFSAELFYTLLITYCTVIIGFGLLYFILSFQGIILVEDNELRQVSVLGSIIHSFYFSGATLLTIGYGDITPIGIGRLIALIEALIGYILPTAFVMRLVQIRHRSRDE